MQILHLSDTHNQHRQLGNLPAADVIIHAGNHDYALERKAPERIQRFLPENCFYLYNSGVTINEIRFWGIPFFFSPDEPNSNTKTIDLVPNDADVIITHRPPFGILDQSSNTRFGCSNLLQAVTRIRPAYHLFGHIHDAYGIEKHKEITFSNAAVVDADYRLVNDPILFEL